MNPSDLTALVAEYRARYGSGRCAESGFFANMPGLRDVIRAAATARTPEGKCNPHQRRIGLARLRVFEQQVQRLGGRIARCVSFDELHALLSENRTEKIGDLAVYDTAVRIGHYLHLAPDMVYFHAGTRLGAKALGLNTKSPAIDVADLPLPLRGLTPSQVEDFLCIYKDQLGRATKSLPSKCVPIVSSGECGRDLKASGCCRDLRQSDRGSNSTSQRNVRRRKCH